MSSASSAMLDVDGRVWLSEDPRLILIHVVIENAIDKIDIIQHLISDGKHNDQHNDAIGTILQQRQALHFEYQRRMSTRSSTNDWNRKKILDDAQATQVLIQRLRLLDQTMQKHIRNEWAASATAVLKMRREKTRALNVMQKSIKELEDTGRCDSLTEILAEETRHQNLFEETLTLVKQLVEGNAALERQIHDDAASNAIELQAKESKAQKLKDQLAQLHGPIETDQNTAEMKARARIRTQTRLIQKQINETNRVVAVAQSDLDTHRKAQEFAEAYFKRKLEMAEVQLTDWLRRRQDDETQTSRRLEQVRVDREAQLDEIETLKEVIEKEQAIKHTRMETERRAAELQRLRMTAAIRIQARVRGFLVRNRVKMSKQGSKKSKKGGKKSKSKK